MKKFDLKNRINSRWLLILSKIYGTFDRLMLKLVMIQHYMNVGYERFLTSNIII